MLESLDECTLDPFVDFSVSLRKLLQETKQGADILVVQRPVRFLIAAFRKSDPVMFVVHMGADAGSEVRCLGNAERYTLRKEMWSGFGGGEPSADKDVAWGYGDSNHTRISVVLLPYR